MDSIISMDEHMEFGETLETRLKRYQACLSEFEQLQYTDPYILQVKEDISQLKAMIAEEG
jgi:hypothetical protein